MMIDMTKSWVSRMSCASLLAASLAGCATNSATDAMSDSVVNSSAVNVVTDQGTVAADYEMHQQKPLVEGKEYLAMINRPHQLHIIDMETDSRYKTCPLAGDFGPGTMVIAPDNKTAFILTNHYKKVYGIDLDNCETTFSVDFKQAWNERTVSMMAMALSPDGSELYTVQNPVLLNRDHYRVQDTRMVVYQVADGLDAKPIRQFPAPRQVSVMATAKDGSLFLSGPDIYKMDVNTGEYDVAIASRNWQRPLYAPPDVLAMWPIQSPANNFTILYTTAKFQDESYDMNTAEWIYGYFNVDLDSGEVSTTDFAPFTEIYFTGMRSPKDENHMFGVLNGLAKYDIKEKKLLQRAELDHSYYCLAFSHDGNKIYAGGTYNDLAIFDANNLQQLSKLELPGGDSSPSTLQVFIR